MYDTLFEPLTLKGLTLKNRIVFAPTTMGLPEEQLLAKIGAIAAGGAAMITVGDVAVRKGPGQSLFHKKGFAAYQRLTQIIHQNGAYACAQLHLSDSDWKSMLKYVPGILTKKITMEELRPLLNQQVAPYITGLSAEKVHSITAAFATAATLARKAGFDMIQVHGDRMCGSFSSAIFNHRTDLYGGSAENRARFAIEAISAVRQAEPTLPIEFKLAVRQENPHYGNAGILLEELPIFVPLLVQAGVDSFHVTLANHSALSDTIPPKHHPIFHDEGCFLPYCDQVRAYTTVPLCGVGGLTHPDFIQAQIDSGRIQYAAMSRQLLADPDWPRKTAAGETDTIHYCIRCNAACLGGLQQHKGTHCIFESEVRP